VAATSSVLVLHMDWMDTGAPPPTGTFPTMICLVIGTLPLRSHFLFQQAINIGVKHLSPLVDALAQCALQGEPGLLQHPAGSDIICHGFCVDPDNVQLLKGLPADLPGRPGHNTLPPKGLPKEIAQL